MRKANKKSNRIHFITTDNNKSVIVKYCKQRNITVSFALNNIIAQLQAGSIKLDL